LAARAVVIKIRLILHIKNPALYLPCRKPSTLHINNAFQLPTWLETNTQPTSTHTEHTAQGSSPGLLVALLLPSEPEDGQGIILRTRTSKPSKCWNLGIY